MRFLITGAAGFLGRAVTRMLSEAGHELTLTTHRRAAPSSFSGFTVASGDVRDVAFLRKALEAGKHDGVCHLAALTGIRDSEGQAADYFDVNLGGTVSLLTAIQGLPAELRPATVVLASTRAVYDDGLPATTIREDFDSTNSNPYGLSKLLAERVLALHSAAAGFSAWSLRCFNISGGLPGITDPDTSRLIPRLLAAAKGAMPPPPIVAPHHAIDYTHVTDVAEAFRNALESEPRPGTHRTVNIGSGVGTSIEDVIRGISKALGHDVPVVLPAQQVEFDAGGTVADVTAARALLGWRPVREIDEILADAALNQNEST